MTDQFDSPECRDAARALVVAADRLQRAIADASPEKGREVLTVLRLAGAQPVVTILQTDAGAFEVSAGLIDRDAGQNVQTYERQFVRTDVQAPLPQ